MKKRLCFLFVSMILVFSACSSSDQVLSTEVIEEEAEATEKKEDQEVGLIACYDDQVMEILDGSISGDTLTVQIRFTNNSSEGFYAYESFACIAYQDGKELEEVTDINDDEMGVELIREVKDGASIEGEYKFTITGDSNIEFFICTPTAEQDVLAKKVFTQVESDEMSEEKSNESSVSVPEVVECDVELYDGEYGKLTLIAISSEGFIFDYENTSSIELSLYSQFLTVDGVQYNDGWIDDELYYGGIADDVSVGMPFRCGFYIPNNNVNASSVAGQIQVCEYPEGTVLGVIAFNVGLNGGEPFDQPAQGQELYNGEFGVLTLTSVADTGFYFTYKNTSSQDYALYSEFLTVDGVQYDDEWIDDDTYYGGIMDNVSPDMTYNCSFHIPDNNVEASKIAGQIQVTDYPEGTVLGNIVFNTEIDLK